MRHGINRFFYRGTLNAQRQDAKQSQRKSVALKRFVLGTAEVRCLEERVRDLERMLGRKTLEVEILKEALDLARAKKAISLSNSAPRDSSR